jgi:hypothetical protein
MTLEERTKELRTKEQRRCVTLHKATPKQPQESFSKRKSGHFDHIHQVSSLLLTEFADQKASEPTKSAVKYQSVHGLC